ncbi:hypothetical protein Pan216_17490 [Planctomycetes bacterium Pan216]|uniref:Uncharacterized protein n=1 Tax=Kolteria novifilia TaxID=2527975 RepID=A0A518B1U6_9BACT|nr:hypothetical protein Pan216_17490 [Planctomycetes bacterium Pan216]
MKKKKAAKSADSCVTERREGEDRRKQDVPVAVDRRKGERRRQIDPTTCERDYGNDEVEFMKAMDEYKREFARPFPTWSEVLEVAHALGYRKVADPVSIASIRYKNKPNPNADEDASQDAD